MARAGLAAAARRRPLGGHALGPGSDARRPTARPPSPRRPRNGPPRELGLTAGSGPRRLGPARLAGLVEVHGDTARPGWRLRAWDRDDSAVLRGWVALFDAWSLAHPAARRTQRARAPVAEVV